MARLPQLVDALTAADGRRDRATIDNIARACRKDGLLPPSLRGHGASPMTVRNAADLLIAVTMPVPRGKAARAAGEFRTLHSTPSKMAYYETTTPRSAGSQWLAPAQLAEAQTFGEALEFLIEQAEEIGSSLMQWTDANYSYMPEEDRYKLCLPHLTVGFITPLRAYVSVTFNRGEGPVEEFRCDYGLNVNLLFLNAYTDATLQNSDWELETRVRLGTILRLHDALADADDAEGDDE